MLALLLVPALAVSAAPVRLALPELNAVNLAPGETDLYTEVLAQKLSAHGLEVMSSRDIATLLGVERQKALLGCTDSASCLVEIVGALDAHGVIVGDIGHLAEGYAVNVKVVSTAASRPLALYTGRAAGAESLRALLEQAAWEVAHQLAKSLGRPELAPAGPRPELKQGPSPKWWALAPAAVAAGAGVVSALAFADTQAQVRTIRTTNSLDAALTARDAGKDAQRTAVIAGVVAGAGAAAAVLVALLAGQDAPVTPVAAFGPGGASVGVVGVLP